jgi:hypothetical protein
MKTMNPSCLFLLTFGYWIVLAPYFKTIALIDSHENPRRHRPGTSHWATSKLDQRRFFPLVPPLAVSRNIARGATVMATQTNNKDGAISQQTGKVPEDEEPMEISMFRFLATPMKISMFLFLATPLLDSS